MASRGLTPTGCSVTEEPPSDEACCPNDCPIGPTGQALYESYYCDGFTPTICGRTWAKCGVCSGDFARPQGGECEEAHWITWMEHPDGGSFYSKKFCEEENGNVVDATYTDPDCMF